MFVREKVALPVVEPDYSQVGFLVLVGGETLGVVEHGAGKTTQGCLIELQEGAVQGTKGGLGPATLE